MIPVPDTGNSAAIGYAARSGISYGEALIKNRYIGRTFINPEDQVRKLGIRMKFNPLSSAIKGKRLVVVDDSIVRGNTTRALVRVLVRGWGQGSASAHQLASHRLPLFLRHRHGQPGRVHRLRQERGRDHRGAGGHLRRLPVAGWPDAGDRRGERGEDLLRGLLHRRLPLRSSRATALLQVPLRSRTPARLPTAEPAGPHSAFWRPGLRFRQPAKASCQPSMPSRASTPC